MTHLIDPEVGAVLAALPESPVAARGDWAALRAIGNANLAALAALTPVPSNVRISRYETNAADGAAIELRWYSAAEPVGGSAEAPVAGPSVLYAHGGGMLMGDLDRYDSVVAGYVASTGVPFLSVQYRLAPEVAGTVPVEDTVAALVWLREHADELGVDPARIAVMGDSAGGGVAAGVAITARERGIELARQILVYPMLDDRNLTPVPAMEPFLTWTYDNNYTGWSALLGDELGSDDVSPAAVPARLVDHGELAPAYIEVGDLDIFRDEDIAYAGALAAAGVPVELHVHPGAPHGFERFAPESAVARRALADRARVISSL